MPEDPLLLLTQDEFDRLLRLISTYRSEAKRCREAKSYLAGCVMLAGALEASLMAMAQCFPEDVATAQSCPTRSGNPRPLRDWRLTDLIAVARELAWLPARLDLGGEFDHKLAQVGDYAEVVRQLRNLVHPARYLQDMPGKRITKKYLDLAEELLAAANGHLYNRLVTAIKAQLPDEE